jgi:hypothetical protein
MNPVRTLAALAASLTLGACTAGSLSGPAGMITPGKDKTAAAFEQDQAVCQQHAISHTGYGDQSAPTSPAPTSPAPTSPAPTPSAAAPSTPATASQSGPATVAAQPSDDVDFMQCMAARGDTVQVASAAYPYPYPYAAPYPYAYPYGYPFAYPGYGFFFGGGRFHVRSFHHDFFHHGGFHGGGFHGGFHGGHGFHGGGHR